MALALDASTPAAVHSAVNVTTATTASFTPPAGSILVVFWAGDDDTGVSQPGAPSITDSLGSHLTYTQTDWSRAADTSNVGNGQAAIWWAPVATSAAMTVTVTNGNTNPTSGNDAHLRVAVITGALTSAPIGAHGKSGGTTQTGTATYSSTADNSWAWIAFADWNASASHPTLQSGCTEDSWTTLSGQSTGWVARGTSTTGASGTSVTVGASAPTVEGRYAYVEILPAVTEVGTTTYATANTATITTGSFTPANNTLLVAYCSMGNGAGTSSSLGTVTDSLSGSWTRLAGDASTTGGVAEIWCRDIATGASMTVTYDPGGSGASGLDIICKWYSGAAATASQPGATATLGGTTAYTKAITTTKTGSLVAGAYGRATDAQTLVANSSTTILGQVNGSSGDTASLFRATNQTGTPGSTTLGFTNVAGGANRMALAEILPAPVSSPAAADSGWYSPELPPDLLFELLVGNQHLWQPTPSGPQSYSQSFAGSITPTGALANLVTKPGFAGTVGPTGALAKQANKALAGTLTSSGSVVRATLKALAGTATSAGALAKAVTKPGLAGSSTPTGALAKLVSKALSGTLTSSGALSTIKVVLRSFAGTLTSSGALAKQANKALAGSVASAGALTRQTAKALAGALTSSGSLVRVTSKKLAGTLTSSGALSTTKVVLRAFAGTMTSSGALTRQAQKALAGTFTTSGSLKRAAAKALSAALSSAGGLAKLVAKPLAGSAVLSGLAQIVKGVFGLPGFLFPSTRSGSATSTTKGPSVGESTTAGRIGSATSSAHLESSTDGGEA